MIGLAVIGIVLIILSPFTLAYDPSGLNRWLFAGLGVGLVATAIVAEGVDIWSSWRKAKREKEGK